jgi:hypothetical protein
VFFHHPSILRRLACCRARSSVDQPAERLSRGRVRCGRVTDVLSLLVVGVLALLFACLIVAYATVDDLASGPEDTEPGRPHR